MKPVHVPGRAAVIQRFLLKIRKLFVLEMYKLVFQ
jgi:hypothetical protein